jgi:L-threonylcarbamoyladenylate synthase
MSDLASAATALREGQLVVVPTDTVYGVAAHPGVEGAVGRLFWVKGRPIDKAIPILGASQDELAKLARFDERAALLVGEFWPGPLTLVLPRAGGFDLDLGGSETETVAVRIPDHPVTLDLLEQTGPLAVTSANLSGEPAATTFDAARAALGERVTVYLDAGETQGMGSTVVSLVGDPLCLREGDLAFKDILAALG